MKRISMTIMCVLGIMTMSAQEIDKTKVLEQAAAAQSVQADLKSVDTGEKAWKLSGSVGLNAAATGLWNWAAGGNNNVSGLAYGRLRLLYHKNSIAWDTNLGLEYGLTWIDQEFDALQKSSDKIDFSTKFGWEFKKTWYLTVLGGFHTQFANGRSYSGTADFDPIISRALAPSYTDISVGIDWKPNDIFSVYLSPVAGRITTSYIAQSVNEAYNEEWNNFYANECGSKEAAQVSADWDKYKPGTDGDLEHQLKNKYAVWHYKTLEDGTIEKNFDRNAMVELGLSFKGAIDYTYKDLKIQTTLSLFTPYAWNKTKVYEGTDGRLYAEDKITVGPEYKYIGYLDNNRRFGNFDVDWTVALSYQFLKCLQVTLSTNLKYYNGVKIDKIYGKGTPEEHIESAERVQFQGIVGIGVGYSF